MTTNDYLKRAEDARDKIRGKFVELGIADSGAQLPELAEAAEEMPNRGAIRQTIAPGGKVKIPEGWHNGEGEITAEGAAEIKLQSKSVTPTKATQTVRADASFDGLEEVEVKPIPDEYIQPTGMVTIKKDGVYDATNWKQATIQAAANVVQPALQSKTVTPLKVYQGVRPDSGYYGLSEVGVQPIPDEYIKPSGTVQVTSNGEHDVRTAEKVNVLVEGGGGGGDDVVDSIIEGTIASMYNSRVSRIDPYKFYYCESLATVDFPNATDVGAAAFISCIKLSYANIPKASQIGMSAFFSCYNLTSANFPEATVVWSGAFQHCYKLTDVNLPKITVIYGSVFQSCKNLAAIDLAGAKEVSVYAFAFCSSLVNVNLPNVSSVAGSAFAFCTGLSSICLPAAKSIGYGAFSGCPNLTTVDFPLLSKISPSTFNGCLKLENVNIPLVSSIDSYAFRSCSSLTSINLPAVTYISASAFASCTKLATIALGASSRCSLANSNAFSGTGIGSNKGSIYVPASFVDTYKSANYWSFFATQILPIPE